MKAFVVQFLLSFSNYDCSNHQWRMHDFGVKIRWKVHGLYANMLIFGGRLKYQN